MKYIKISISVLCMISVASLAEGVGSRGGGNAKVCFDDPTIPDTLTITGSNVSKVIPDKYFKNIVSVKTLDLSDAENLISGPGQVRIEPLKTGESYWDYGLRLAHNFDSLLMVADSTKYQKYSSLIEEGKETFGRNISFDTAVFPQDDINPLAPAGDGCVYTTIAVQRSIGSHRRELAIDGRYFNRLTSSQHSELSKAVLIMHEYYLAEANELSTHPVLSTEGVREFVARSIRKDSMYKDIIEVLNRRKLFSLRFIGEPRYVPLERLLNEFRNSKSQSIYQTLHALQPEFFAAVQPVYEQLPNWYKRKNPLNNIDALYSGNLFGRCFFDRCLNDSNFERLNQINLKVIELSNTILYQVVAEKLKSLRSDREQKFKKILNQINNEPILSAGISAELGAVLSEWVKTGFPMAQQASNRFTEINPNDAWGPTVKIKPEAISAN